MDSGLRRRAETRRTTSLVAQTDRLSGATCEMPIYSLANIASDRTDPEWRLAGFGIGSGCGSGSGSYWVFSGLNPNSRPLISISSGSATYADMTARISGLSGLLGYWIMCKNLKCKQLYAFIVSLGRRPPLKLHRKTQESNRKGSGVGLFGRTAEEPRKRFRLIKLADSLGAFCSLVVFYFIFLSKNWFKHFLESP